MTSGDHDGQQTETFPDFHALDEPQQVARIERLAACALAAWDLPDPHVESIKYRENAVFAVRAANGRRAVLRVHRPGYRSDLDIACELAWMSALGSAGVDAPAAIATRGDELITTASHPAVPEPRQCDLLDWVEGSSPGTLEAGVFASDESVRELYRSVGSIAARMHVHAKGWKRPEPFSRPSWNVETLAGEHPTFGRFWELGELEPPQLEVLMRARDRVRSRLDDLGPVTRLIHGDLVPDNILVDGARQRIIDFDDFGWSWIGFEMATSLFPLQLSGGFDAGLEGYLEGYRGITAFPDEELELLPEMLLARGLSYLGWPLGRPEIRSARMLVPMFAAVLSDAAAEYLARD
ncbi:MAG TPA: phosphotransferase [Candidatus Limnocylindrales bacterium]|nr:phosphotransferase [Candidatus Limnocylindrales bacterium]